MSSGARGTAPPIRVRLSFAAVRRIPDRPKPLRSVLAHRLARRERAGIAHLRVRGGVELELNLGDWLSRLYYAGALDQAQRAAAERLVPAGGAVVDVGANIGLWTCSLARHVGPDGRVDAVEPYPENLERLRANVDRNSLSNVRILDVALSDREGTLALFAPAGHPGGGSGSIGARDPGDGVSLGDVPCVRLDSVYDGGRLDLLKIDVEGHELEVLAGALGTIDRLRPSILCEVIAPDVREGIDRFCAELRYRALVRTGRVGLGPPHPDRPPSDLFLVPSEREDVA